VGLARTLAPKGTRRGNLARKAVRTLRRFKRRLDWRIRTDRALRDEEDQLKRSWARHAPENLSEYLVTGYQNQRINVQSILARHFFIRRLFGTEFDEVMRQELEFAVAANEAIRKRAAELGVRVSAFIQPERRAEVQRVCEVIADRERTFETRWREILGSRSAPPVTVLEFACGSANDYRAFADYGVARFLDYTGVDLNDNNIANARRRHPDVNFQVGSVLSLPFEDRSFEFVLAFDIFEHLSLAAMDQALTEAMRLARDGLVLSFFSMVDAPRHKERPKRSYFWNDVSARKVAERLREQFSDVRVTHIPSYLRSEFGYTRSYNKKGYTIIALDRR
jgi:ubiquinone/menaquinone biosynthesis C-methylase UbiE